MMMHIMCRNDKRGTEILINQPGLFLFFFLFHVCFVSKCRPSTSSAEDIVGVDSDHYDAERRGSNGEDCLQYMAWCPEGPLNLISKWL